MTRTSIGLSLTVAALGALGLGEASAQDGKRTVSLAEAVQLAERYDPTVVSARQGVRVAGVGIKAAYGNFLPSLAATSNYNTFFSGGPSRINPVTGEVISGNTTTTSVTAGLEATLSLQNGYGTFSSVSTARHREDQAEASYDQQRASLELRTTNAFLDALQAADLMVVREEGVTRAEEQFRVALSKLQTRAGTVVDSLQAAITLGQARLQLMRQEAQLAAAEATLAALIGEDGRVAAEADSGLFRPVAIADTSILIAEAEQRSPTVTRAEAGLRVAESERRVAKAAYFPVPSLTIGAGTSLRGNSFDDFNRLSNRSLNFGLSFPIFNGFLRERNVAEASSRAETARAETEDARRQAGAAMIGRLANLRAADRQLEVSITVLDAARANLRVQIERYRLGSVTSEALNIAQDNLNRAESDAVQARYEYVRARAQIEAVLGRKL